MGVWWSCAWGQALAVMHHQTPRMGSGIRTRDARNENPPLYHWAIPTSDGDDEKWLAIDSQPFNLIDSITSLSVRSFHTGNLRTLRDIRWAKRKGGELTVRMRNGSWLGGSVSCLLRLSACWEDTGGNCLLREKVTSFSSREHNLFDSKQWPHSRSSAAKSLFRNTLYLSHC